MPDEPVFFVLAIALAMHVAVQCYGPQHWCLQLFGHAMATALYGQTRVLVAEAAPADQGQLGRIGRAAAQAVWTLLRQLFTDLTRTLGGICLFCALAWHCWSWATAVVEQAPVDTLLLTVCTRELVACQNFYGQN